ncbi:hypothetical protein [Mycobacteroides abscessus]|uniref:hypothetical protein n=1 Tax=Mycobacteroides abscessus TaxID=36809 RepID=UPI001041EE08|nr:hypothetical protein [Mycobacteroides abscessus]
MMEYVDDAILNKVRVLIERARRLHGISVADEAALDHCWTVVASIEVPHALAKITGTSAQHSPGGVVGEFFDAMNSVVDTVRSVVSHYEDDGAAALAKQAHDDMKAPAVIAGRGALDDCDCTTRLLEAAEISAATDLGTPGGYKTVMATIENRRNKALAKRASTAKTERAQRDQES